MIPLPARRPDTKRRALCVALAGTLACNDAWVQTSDLSRLSNSLAGVGAGLVAITSVFAISFSVTTMVPNGRRVLMSRRSVGWGVAGLVVGILTVAGAIPLALVDVGESRQAFSTGSAVLMGCTGLAGIALGVADLRLPARSPRASIAASPLILASTSGAIFGVTVVTAGL